MLIIWYIYIYSGWLCIMHDMMWNDIWCVWCVYELIYGMYDVAMKWYMACMAWMWNDMWYVLCEHSMVYGVLYTYMM